MTFVPTSAAAGIAPASRKSAFPDDVLASFTDMFAWLADNPGDANRQYVNVDGRVQAWTVSGQQALTKRAFDYATSVVVTPADGEIPAVTLADTGRYKVTFDIAGERKALYNGKSGSAREATLMVAFVPSDDVSDDDDDDATPDDTTPEPGTPVADDTPRRGRKAS